MPAGARISAGKSGNVAMSLPRSAERVGELRAGQLHAVAGIAGEADGDRLELLHLRRVSGMSRSLRGQIGNAHGSCSCYICSRIRENSADLARSPAEFSRIQLQESPDRFPRIVIRLPAFCGTDPGLGGRFLIGCRKVLDQIVHDPSDREDAHGPAILINHGQMPVAAFHGA